MRFDDRLTTVLAQPASDPHDRAVRWRQLVELLARAGGELDSPVSRQALDEVRGLVPIIDEQVRAAAARAIAGLRLPVELIAVFAGDSLTVAAPILAAARLTPEQWRELRRGAQPEAARFIDSLHPGLGDAEDRAVIETEPEPPIEAAAAAEPAPAPAEQAAMPSISDLVARIDRLRRTRQATARRQQGEGAAPVGGATGLFRWESDPSGEIAWVDGIPRGALIGRSLANAGEEGFDPRVERAFALRAPFRDAATTLAREGVLVGEWRLSGVPAFEPADGRFAGYRGVGVRAAADTANGTAQTARRAEPDHDALRELVHEIKTPLNAILGFAEIIERQYLGPADRRYRSRAADITGQARVLLEAIDDLDLAARLQSSEPGAQEHTDLAGLLTRLGADLSERAAARGASVSVTSEGHQRCRLPEALADRLIRRFLLALVDALDAGETLVIKTAMESQRCLIAVDRPGLLAGADLGALLSAPPEGEEGAAQLLFSLRLVRGLARIVGGDLDIDGQRIVLALPAA